jgi:cytoskeleton protein RodZ
MGDFGQNLRREREARGVALEDISRATKISVRLLQAIEDEEFERLPGGIFNVNFVRQYARQLGLDDERIVSEFRRLTAPPVETETPRSSLPPEWIARAAEQRAREREPRVWMAATVVVAAIAIGGAAYLIWSGRRAPALERLSPPAASAPTPAAPAGIPEPTRPEGLPADSAQSLSSRPSTPEEHAPAVERPASAAPQNPASPTAAAIQSRKPAPAAGAAPIHEQTASSPTQPAALSSGVTPAADVSSETPAETVWAEAPVRVEIQATSIVWVGASADGQPRFQTTLRAQQTRRIAAQSSVRLRVGDAGALMVTLNGQPQPPIGPKGQVRTVILTAQGMRVLAPPSAAPPSEGARPADTTEIQQGAGGAAEAGPNP